MVANVFSPAQITAARYGREIVPYTWGPALLPKGTTTVFDVSSWTGPNSPDKIVALVWVAATQNAGVQLVWNYDGQQSNAGQGYTDAMQAGLVPAQINAWAANRLALQIVNSSGAAIANFQLNYAVMVWELPTSYDDLLGYAPSAEDTLLLNSLPAAKDGTTAAQQLAQLVNKGTLPIAWVETYNHLWANRRLPDPPNSVPRHVTTASALLPSSFTVPIPTGTVGVLEEIGFEGQPAGVLLTVDRDLDTAYVSVNAAAIARTDDAPMAAWVPATSSFTFNVSGGVGTYALYPKVRLYGLSELLALQLGTAKTPAINYGKVRSGFQ
jgi:hypothetical protein